MASLSLESNETMTAYMKPFPLPKSSKSQLVYLIKHWVDHRGLEWTVKRLKDLKQQRIHFAVGSNRTLVKSKGSIPVGPFKVLWNSSLSLSHALQILNIYTCVISRTITSSQAKKFLSAVKQEPVVNNIKVDTSAVNVPKFWCRFPHPTVWLRSSTARAPYIYDDRVDSFIERELYADAIIDSVGGDISTRSHLFKYANLYSRSVWMNKLDFIEYLANMKVNVTDYYSKVNLPPVIGKIGLIQERGMKLRAVANPARIFQQAFTPMGKWLYDILKGMQSDCTFDQSKGILYAQDCLRQGKTMFAFDLSNATDSFPLDYQLDVLRSLSCHTWLGEDNSYIGSLIGETIEAFIEVARGRWYSKPLSKWNDNSSYLQWTKGQPLGLYPSFALFAVSHNVLLLNIEEEFNVSDTFRILGDDIIISDSRVAARYKEILSQWKVKIADEKSLVSNQLTEFGGKVISKDGILDVHKWKPYSTKNILGPLQVLGIDGLSFVPPKMRKVVAFAATLPKPFGLEINPKGIPLQDRVDALDHKLWSKSFSPVQVPVIPRDDLSREIISFWKHHNEIYTTKGYDTFNSQNHYGIQLPIDQISSEDLLNIQHYNAYIKMLKNWDTPTIQPPKVPFSPVRGDPRTKMLSSSGIFKFVENLKKVIKSHKPII